MKIWSIIKMKLIGLFLLSSFSIAFLYAIRGPVMTQFISIVKWSDVIEFSYATLMGISGLPIIAIFIVLSIIGIFKKDIEPVKISKPLEMPLIIITLVSLGSGFISTVILFIVIALSPYTSCHFKGITVTKYYVNDPGLCKTIKPFGDK